MMFLATLALLPALIVHEKHSRNKTSTESDLSIDEQWSKKKKELNKVRDDIAKVKDPEQKQKLQRNRVFLENELRRIEWKVRESDLTQMYNASKGKLRELPDLRGPSQENDVTGAILTKRYRNTLSSIVKDANSILEHEPQASRSEALAPIVSLLRAYYNNVKKSSEQSSRAVAVDYFVTWAMLSSVSKGVAIDPKLSKYASPEFLKNFEKLMEKAKLGGPSFQSTGRSGVVPE